MPELTLEYDVALSFASEDRKHADTLAKSLKTKGVKVFYDADEKASLWGKDLPVHLYDIYSRRARFCVLFVSRRYVEQAWTSHECRAAQERALQERGHEYILPIRIDDTKIPGLPETIGYIDIGEGIDKISEMLFEKTAGARPILGPDPLDPPHEANSKRKAFTSLPNEQLNLEDDLSAYMDYGSYSGQPPPSIEIEKYRLSVSAKVLTERKEYVRAAERKLELAEICRSQGKKDDAHLLEQSAHALLEKAVEKQGRNYEAARVLREWASRLRQGGNASDAYLLDLTADNYFRRVVR